jgi:hypothetical protein
MDRGAAEPRLHCAALRMAPSHGACSARIIRLGGFPTRKSLLWFVLLYIVHLKERADQQRIQRQIPEWLGPYPADGDTRFQTATITFMNELRLHICR